MKIIGTLFTLLVLFCAVLWVFPQDKPTTLQPVALTELEKAKEQNIMLRLEILRRDQQDFVAEAARAHNLDISKYRFDADAGAFFPLAMAPRPAAPLAPAVHPPAKKQ